MTRDFPFKTRFFESKFKLYLEKTLMLNEAPGNLRVNLRTLLKRANCKSLYSSTKHVLKITTQKCIPALNR